MSRVEEGRRLFTEYREAAEDLRNMGWADDEEWTRAEHRLAAAQQAMDAFLGGVE